MEFDPYQGIKVTVALVIALAIKQKALHFAIGLTNRFSGPTIMSDILRVVETSAGVDRLAWSLWCRAWLPVEGASPLRNPGGG